MTFSPESNKKWKCASRGVIIGMIWKRFIGMKAGSDIVNHGNPNAPALEPDRKATCQPTSRLE